MKLIRYGEPFNERPGFIDEYGRIRDFSSVVADISPEALGEDFLVELKEVSQAATLPVVEGEQRLGACVCIPGKFICVGLNYHEHIREIGATIPEEPVIFMKAPNALSGPFDDVVMPPGATEMDWEVELGVVMGSRARRVTPEQAISHVAGYCVVNDVSERNWQLRGTGQWVKGKSADTFAPIGPWLVTRDEISNPQQLTLKLSVNGELQQEGCTSDMVFPVNYLISYISHFMTLLPGDVISTGTPPGVGMGQRPPRYLKPGDLMELTIEGLSTQLQRVVVATD